MEQFQADGSVFFLALGALLIGWLVFGFIRNSRKIGDKGSEKLLILDDGNFKNTIGNGMTLVDFWAPWCQPCKVQGPIISEIADEVGDKYQIAKLNIDENQKTASLVGIKSIPTIVIFRNGRPVKRYTGLKSKSTLINALKNH